MAVRFELHLIRITERTFIPKVWGRARAIGEPLDLPLVQRALEGRVALPVRVAEVADRSELDAICLALGPLGLRFNVVKVGEPDPLDKPEPSGGCAGSGYRSARRVTPPPPRAVARGLVASALYFVRSLPMAVQLGGMVVALALLVVVGLASAMKLAPGLFDTEPASYEQGFHGGEFAPGVLGEGARLRPGGSGGGSGSGADLGSGRSSGHGATPEQRSGPQDGQAMLEALGSGPGEAVDENAKIDTRTGPIGSGGGGSTQAHEDEAAPGAASADEHSERAVSARRDRQREAREHAAESDRAPPQATGEVLQWTEKKRERSEEERASSGASPAQQAADSGSGPEPVGAGLPFVGMAGVLAGVVLGFWIVGQARRLGPRREPWFMGAASCALLLGAGVAGWIHYDQRIAIADPLEPELPEASAGPFRDFVSREAEEAAEAGCAPSLAPFAHLLCEIRAMRDRPGGFAAVPVDPRGPFQRFVDDQRSDKDDACADDLQPFTGLLCQFREMAPPQEPQAVSEREPVEAAETVPPAEEIGDAEAVARGPASEPGPEHGASEPSTDGAAAEEGPAHAAASPAAPSSPVAGAAEASPEVSLSDRLRALLFTLLDFVLGAFAGTFIGGFCGYGRRWLGIR